MGLHLLPLSIPRAVHDAGQEPVNLLDDALVVDAFEGQSVARADGETLEHYVGSQKPSATTAGAASTTTAVIALLNPWKKC